MEPSTQASIKPGFEHFCRCISDYFERNEPEMLPTIREWMTPAEEEVRDLRIAHNALLTTAHASEFEPVKLRFRKADDGQGAEFYLMLDPKGEAMMFEGDLFYVYKREDCEHFAASLGLGCTFEGE